MNAELLRALKSGMSGLWSLGDYRALAPMLQGEADALAAACGVGPGQEVLDVGAGTGNFAAAAARRGARVLATDLSPQMVEWGRARTTGEGLEVEWREADAEALPFGDGRFDLVASTFGAMFAPQPEVVASELFRVVRPGGLVAMANWRLEGFTGRYSALMTSFGPTAPGPLPSPFLWGEPEQVRQRFQDLAASIETERRSLWFEFESVETGRAFWERCNPGTSALERVLPPERYREFLEEGRDLIAELNQAADGRLALESRYLVVLARAR